MESSWKDKFKAHWKEVAIIAALLLASVIAAIVLSFPSPKPCIAIIKHRSETVMKVDLSKETSERSFLVKGDHGDVEVMVRKDEIKIDESNCPSQFCVHLGWVKAGGKPIVCAHNGISITFAEDSGNTAILG